MKKFIIAALLLSSVTSVHAATTSVSFTWDAPTETNVVSYKLYCLTSATPPFTLVGASNSIGITVNLDATTLSNYCAVTAVNDWGLESDYSNVVRLYPNVKPAPLKGLRKN